MKCHGTEKIFPYSRVFVVAKNPFPQIVRVMAKIFVIAG